jgi:phosphate uptake regulator/aminoglycoside phosphotransferase (APT) family kinase protein
MARLAETQLRRAITSFVDGDLETAEKIIEGDDVVDNLNLAIEERCFALAAMATLSAEEVRAVRATLKVGINFERIGDAGTHIAKQVRILNREDCPRVPFDFGEAPAIALRAVDDARRAFLDSDLGLARQACLHEPAFDKVFVQRLHDLEGRIQAAPEEAPFLLHCLSVLKYLEKVADFVLNIGEQTLFRITGRRLKFSQYEQLDRLLGEPAAQAYDVRAYGDGTSGAFVARVSRSDSAAVYKEGHYRKIEAEREKLDAWQRVRAGLTPRVLGTVSLADRRALLTEFVEGSLLSELYASEAGMEEKIEATRRLLGVVVSVWEASFRAEAPTVDYVEQIEARLDDVFALHPELRTVAQETTTDHGGLLRLMGLVRRIQPTLAPPFSVWLHGDFNANNVLYRDDADSVKFIDVHRSRYGDYLQDIGVFLLSVDRRSDLGERARAHVMRVNDLVRDTAAAFGLAHGDRTCEQRLHLSLARSCITSGRVVVDPAMAASLFRRGVAHLKGLIQPV